MADTVAVQKLIDSNSRAVFKLNSESDGTGEASVVKVDVSTLLGAVGDGSDRVSIVHIMSDVHCKNKTGHVILEWDGTPNRTILSLGDNKFDWDFQGKGFKLTNDALTPTGDIDLTTHDFKIGDAYTIIVEVRKETAFDA